MNAIPPIMNAVQPYVTDPCVV